MSAEPPPRGGSNQWRLDDETRRARTALAAGRVSEARTICEAILCREPSHLGAMSLLGLALQAAGDPHAALPLFEDVTRRAPTRADAWLRRGLCLIGIGRFAEAAECLAETTRLRPDFPTGLHHHGGALALLGRYAEALPLLERAAALAPADPRIQTLFATVLKWTRGPEAALRQLRTTTAAFPDFAPAWVGQALIHFSLGDYKAAWQLHEWRLKQPNRAEPPGLADIPRWFGEPVAPGTRILVHNDGGLGDAIQFCRLVPLVAARGAVPSLLLPGKLVGLLRGLPGSRCALAEGEALPEFDLRCPLMSLGLALDITVDNVPASVPYLHPPAGLVAAWQARLPEAGLRVGLVWNAAERPGEPWADAYGRRRSMPLAALAPLAEIRGVAFVSLQFGAGAEQARDPPPALVLQDLGDDIADFQALAGLIVNLDLVISVDTSTAHLAGALGKPVWLMSPFDIDWRWIVGRRDSPWYPRHRIFRQDTAGDWRPVVEAVARELAELAASGGRAS